MKKVITLFFVIVIGIGAVSAQQNPQKAYQVTLTGDAWRYIIDKLSEEPLKQVFGLVTSMSTQINAQDLKIDTTSGLKPKTDSANVSKHKK